MLLPNRCGGYADLAARSGVRQADPRRDLRSLAAASEGAVRPAGATSSNEVDNGRFMNHDEQPNTDFTNPTVGFATRDIAKGEELTCNYSEFAPGFEFI